MQSNSYQNKQMQSNDIIILKKYPFNTLKAGTHNRFGP